MARSSSEASSRERAPTSCSSPSRDPPPSHHLEASRKSASHSERPSGRARPNSAHTGARDGLETTTCNASSSPHARAKAPVRTSASAGTDSSRTTTAAASSALDQGRERPRVRRSASEACEASTSTSPSRAAIPKVAGAGATAPRPAHRSPKLPSFATTTIRSAFSPAVRRACARAERSGMRDREAHPVATRGSAPRRRSRRAAPRSRPRANVVLTSHNNPLASRTSSFQASQMTTMTTTIARTTRMTKTTSSNTPPARSRAAKSTTLAVNSLSTARPPGRASRRDSARCAARDRRWVRSRG